MKKYSVCVQVWHKPEGMRSWHKLNVIYIPCDGANRTEAKQSVKEAFDVLPYSDFKHTVKFANPFNAAYHK